MLELSNLTKKYGLNPVINIPHFVLEQGIYWLKGANGSGKTTLLKMVAGLLPVTGDIRLDGVSIKQHPVAYRQNVSWAEAEPLYPPFMSGRNLVNLYQNIKKAATAEVQQLIDLFEMNAYIDHKIGTYSAGMTKKLSLLLASIGKSSLIILDEPLITLDVHSVKLVTDLILERNKVHSCSFLMSSHQDLQQEIALAGTIITIHNTTLTLE